MKLNQLFTGILCLFYTTQTWALHNTPGEHWFEIEVIMFSHIGDKSVLKEKFDTSTELPSYSRYLDLLNPYIQPDVQSLKQLLPFCDAPEYPHNVDYTTLYEAQLKAEHSTSANLPIKSLDELQSEALQESNGLSGDGLTDESHITHNTIPPYENGLSDVINDQSDDFYSTNTPATLSNDSPMYEEASIGETPKVFTQEELALLAQAEAEFTPDHEQKVTLLSPKEMASKPLCVWSPQYYQAIKSTNTFMPDYNENAVSELSGVVDSAENIYSNSSYLISQESLQLSDIKKKMSLSKNFKPLLHFGWREHTQNKRNALPLKVFAGDNLAFDYQQELKQYEEDKALLLAQEENLSKILGDNETHIEHSGNANADENVVALSEMIEDEDPTTARLQEIFEQIEDIPSDIELIINQEEASLEASDELLLEEPVLPVQPWYLNGFIKVEVYHYLHITADFNIMNKTLAEQKVLKGKPETPTSDDNTPLFTSINFKQDRRVLSGQIHYFDHPYMGMVLQVRRYKKPEKPHVHENDESSEHTH